MNILEELNRTAARMNMSLDELVNFYRGFSPEYADKLSSIISSAQEDVSCPSEDLHET